jgi:Antenna complex alpha/beta subunit
MALALSNQSTSQGKRGAKRPIEFRIIFAVCFAVFLLAAVVERLLPWKWLAPRSEGKRHLSIFEQAWEAAGTCTTYAFMG